MLNDLEDTLRLSNLEGIAHGWKESWALQRSLDDRCACGGRQRILPSPSGRTPILAPAVGVRHRLQAAMILGLSFKPRQARFHLSRPVLNPLQKVLQHHPTGMAQHHRLYRLR